MRQVLVGLNKKALITSCLNIKFQMPKITNIILSTMKQIVLKINE